MNKHAGTFLTVTGIVYTAIVALLFAIFTHNVAGWSVGCAFIISSFMFSLTGFCFGRYFCPKYEINDVIIDEEEAVAEEASNIPKGSEAKAFAKGLKDMASELRTTKPYEMNITKDGLNEFYCMYEIEHFGVIWECWADGDELIGVDAPPYCKSCGTPLIDIDAKTWRCPNPVCESTHEKPSAIVDPAKEAAMVFIGKLKRREITISDAKHIGSGLDYDLDYEE